MNFYEVPNQRVCRLIKVLSTVFAHSTLLQMCVIGLDRFCSLQYAMRYQLWITPKHLKLASSIFNIVGGLTAVPQMMDRIVGIPGNCALENTPIPYWTSFTIMFVTTIASICAYSVVGFIALRKKRHRQIGIQNGNQYKTFTELSVRSFVVVVLYIVTILPASAMRVLMLRYQPDHVPMSSASNLFMFAFHFICPIIFLISFNESRYQLITLLCCCNTRLQGRFSERYKQHYATYEIATISMKEIPKRRYVSFNKLFSSYHVMFSISKIWFILKADSIVKWFIFVHTTHIHLPLTWSFAYRCIIMYTRITTHLP